MNIYELEPKSVMQFFYAINQIPRGSGNEKEISDYLLRFAKERGLDAIQDEALNVLIRKPATAGYENQTGVILQGHMDMVCSKNADVDHDFTKDPIQMYVDRDDITANGTTLGADNGIAVAMGLALLDANDINHPALEVIITTEEEVGLNGAIAFDGNQLQGGYFINLDSEEEGEFTIGCAGGLKGMLKIPIQRTLINTEDYLCKEIALTKLIGGHSGVDILHYRGNAIKLTGRILCKLKESINFSIVDIEGGEKDNVIPRECFTTLIFPKKDEHLFDEQLDCLAQYIQDEYGQTDSNIELVSKTIDIPKSVHTFSDETISTLLFLLQTLPNGIQTMSPVVQGFVESSLNLGVICCEEEHIVLSSAIRSNKASLKTYISDQLRCYSTYCNVEFVTTADYPAWPDNPNSQLLQQAVDVYKSMYHQEPIIKTIHAGLEVGVFMEKCPHLEAISIGPNMASIHSPDERLSIASTQRTYAYLIKLLESLS